MLTIQSICKPQLGAVDQIVDGEAVIVLPQAGQIKVLNGVGTFIWALLDGKQSIAGIAARVCQEYQVELVQAEADTLEFLGDLETRGMVQVIAR